MSQILTNSLLLLLAILLSACSRDSTQIEGEQSPADQSAHSDHFQLLDGGSATILDDERLQFINYWASWCLPCLEEMPELEAFRHENTNTVEVYAVNYDRLDLDQLRQEFGVLDVDIPAFIGDPHEALGYARPSVLPTTVVMHQGQVKEILVGPQTRETLGDVLQKWQI